MKTKRTKTVLLALLILLLIGGLFSFIKGDSASPVAEMSHPAYPEKWVELDLPQFPNGTMIWSTEGANLQDGIQFVVDVVENADEIADYLEEEFGNRDFDEYDWEPSSDEGGFSTCFNSGDLDVSVDVEPNHDGNGTRVRVGVRRESQSSVAPTNYASVIVD